jgi:hypothetical protein
MPSLKKAIQVLAVSALIVPGTIAITQSSASAAGCSGAYSQGGRVYTISHCTYTSGQVRAKTTCSGTGGTYTAYGVWVKYNGSSSAYCQPSDYASHGTWEHKA